MSSPRLLFCAATFLLSLTTLSAEKPFDFASTPGKLPKHVVPEEYAIRIVPDLGKFVFSGSETVKLKVTQPVRQLVLNALEIKITQRLGRWKGDPAIGHKVRSKGGNADYYAGRRASRPARIVSS